MNGCLMILTFKLPKKLRTFDRMRGSTFPSKKTNIIRTRWICFANGIISNWIKSAFWSLYYGKPSSAAKRRNRVIQSSSKLSCVCCSRSSWTHPCINIVCGSNGPYFIRLSNASRHTFLSRLPLSLLWKTHLKSFSQYGSSSGQSPV